MVKRGYRRFSLQSPESIFFHDSFVSFSSHGQRIEDPWFYAFLHGVWRFGRVMKGCKMLWNGSQYFGPGAETLQWPGIHAGQDARPSLQDACRGPGYSKHQSDANVKYCHNVCPMIRHSDCLNVWISSKDECDYRPPCQPFHCHLLLNSGWNEHLVLLAPVFICFHLINPCLQVDLTSNLLGHSRQQLVAVKWALLHGKMNFMSFFRASFQTCKTKFDTSCRPSDSDLENSYNILRCSSIQVGHPERKNGSCTKRMTSAKDLRKNSATTGTSQAASRCLFSHTTVLSYQSGDFGLHLHFRFLVLKNHLRIFDLLYLLWRLWQLANWQCFRPPWDERTRVAI